MAVPTLITDLNTVIASNVPAGSENVFPQLDDYLRAAFAFIAQNYVNKAALAGAAFTGSVGVGAAAVAGYKLDVTGTIRSIGGEASASGYGVRVLNSTQSGGGSITAPAGAAAGLAVASDGGPLMLLTNVERARINSTGEMGIGKTASANYLLDVNGTMRGIGGEASGAGYGLRLLNSTLNGGGHLTPVAGASNGITLSADSGQIILSAGGSTRAYIATNGAIRYVGLASAPSGPVAGDTYYDSVLNKHRGYDGTQWNNLY